MALKLGDYVITEAGFGADLGAEKFLDIKCRFGGLNPAAVVIVASIRALKLHGGAMLDSLDVENLEALEKGMPNLLKHLENITDMFGVPAVVAVNRFPLDTKAEIALVTDKCRELGVNVALSDVWAQGGAGGIDLAKAVLALCDQPQPVLRYLYQDEDSLEDKIVRIATEIYGADGVEFLPEAKRELRRYRRLRFQRLPVCMAKTQYSLSDDPKRLGRPQNFKITVRSVRISAGAGFVVALTGDIMTMPGLPKKPAAETIDVDGSGRISGLF